MKNPLKRWDVFLTVVFFLIAIPAAYNEIFTLLENQVLSYRHTLRTSFGHPTQFSDEIVLVSLNEERYEMYGNFPIRRTYLDSARGKKPEKPYPSGKVMVGHLNVFLHRMGQKKKAAAS